MPSLIQRIKTGWNAFKQRDPTFNADPRINIEIGNGRSGRPDRRWVSTVSARSVVASAYNRIAVDVSMIQLIHCRTDDDGNYKETIKDELNYCLTTSANLDQTGTDLKRDLVLSLFDEGCIALVPVETTTDPTGDSDAYKVRELRVGQIVTWYPSHVKVKAYNEIRGRFEDIILPKNMVAIIENPFYTVMNEPNSTLKRLLRTINRLDAFNENNASGKLDMIIQLPYIIKSEQRRKEADKRRKDLQDQLKNSPLGIGYIDGTEKIIQLNRALENNLWEQVKDLTAQLYTELGLTQAIIDGTADENAMINYFNNTIAPVCTAICEECKRKFLSATAVSQNQSIMYFRDAFKLVPVAQLADIGDKFRRNEIMTSNELRSKVGLKPSDAEQADTLRNPNLNQSDAEIETQGGEGTGGTDGNGGFNIESVLAKVSDKPIL